MLTTACQSTQQRADRPRVLPNLLSELHNFCFPFASGEGVRGSAQAVMDEGHSVEPRDAASSPENQSAGPSFQPRSPQQLFSARREDTTALPLRELPGPALQRTLEHLPALSLMAASAACKQLAEAAEPVFQAACAQQRWRPPRMPRGHAAQSLFPWRSLHSQHACVACHAPGEFPLREPHGARVTTMLALVCGKCVWKPSVRQRLVLENLSVDLIGRRGQRLLPSSNKKRKGRS